MKRFKFSLAILALVLGIIVSAFSTKPLQAGFWKFDGSNFAYLGTTEPNPAEKCIVISSTICYEERDEDGVVLRTVLDGPYQP